MNNTKVLKELIRRQTFFEDNWHEGLPIAEQAAIELKDLEERIFSLYVVLDERRKTIIQLNQQLEDIKISNLVLRKELINVRNMWRDTIEENKELRAARDAWMNTADKAYKQLMKRRAELDEARKNLQHAVDWVEKFSHDHNYAYCRCPICNCTWYPNEHERHELGCWVTAAMLTAHPREGGK
jgi:DNA repair exonuclease SbcCD ATPase subunit